MYDGQLRFKVTQDQTENSEGNFMRRVHTHNMYDCNLQINKHESTVDVYSLYWHFIKFNFTFVKPQAVFGLESHRIRPALL